MATKEKIDKLRYEREFQTLGAKYIAGVDEVGRGPLAGPVCAAAVIMPLDDIIEGVDDSKKLSPKKREQLSKIIRQKAIAYKICMVDEKVIDEINILNATKLCMKNAIDGLGVEPDIVLVDAIKSLDVRPKVNGIIKGDMLSYSIGCASIIAKVERDEYMKNLACSFPEYAFEKNMGYGTREHIEALKKFGVKDCHRKTFLKFMR